MFKYTLYKSKANNASKGLWYPCIHYEETLDTRALAEHMASHSSAHSPAQVEGVLCDMITCILELCAEGYKIKIPDLGILQYNIHSKGRANKKDFTPNSSILGLRFRVRGTGKNKHERNCYVSQLGIPFVLVDKAEKNRADVEKV